MRKSVFNVSGGYNLNSDSSYDSDEDQEHRRLQLVNFGHSHWGFNNWSWCVNKQDLDFVDHTNNKYCAGVVAFVTISVKTLDIHRENIGYAVCSATSKGNAIYRARKNAVTNALRETFLSFGGNIALSLQDAPVVEVSRAEEAPRGLTPPANTRLRPAAPAHPAHPGAPAHAPPAHGPPAPPPPHASAVPSSPNKSNVTASACAGRARAGPAGGPLSSAAQTCAAGGAGGTLGAPRSNSNVSFVLQPVMAPLYGGGRLAAPGVFPYYECGPWHVSCEAPPALGCAAPPKNLVMARGPSAGCKNACRGDEPPPGPPPPQGCWIKPTIFYDGFWTEQKVKKWVAEQVEKQFPDDGSSHSTSPRNQEPGKS